MNPWQKFIYSLSNDINWDHPSQSEVEKVCVLLKDISSHPNEIIKNVKLVAEDNELFSAYAPHMEYPRPIMDKFVLFMDPEDRFRIRLHKFKSHVDNRGAEAWIHDHRWCFASIILAGSYREEVYTIEHEEEDKFHAILKLSDERCFYPGDINYSLPRVPHLTVNTNENEPCYSLFVRGKSFYPYSRIFNLKTHSFKPSWGLRQELKSEFEYFANSMAPLVTLDEG